MSRYQRILVVVAGGLAAMVLGCRHDASPTSPPIVVCVDPIAGLLVSVVDSATGRLALENATVIATLSPIYADTGRFTDGTAFWVGFHSGTYRVTVTKSGYVPWALERVVVPAVPPPCEGNPAEQVKIRAALIPLSQASIRNEDIHMTSRERERSLTNATKL